MRDTVLKLGVLSDLHFDPVATVRRRWIGWYDAPAVGSRIQAALEWFTGENVDVLVVAGDVAETPTNDELDAAFAALVSGGLPVAVVGGNHDWHPGGVFRQRAEVHGVQLLEADVLEAAVPIAGIAACPLDAGSTRFEATAPQRREIPQIFVSHFPLLSESERLAAAGLPYPGDLVNRRAVLSHIGQAHPTLVLSGHIHARASRIEGNVLQLSCGSLIEPPHDAAVVTVAAGLHEVSRVARRLGPAGVDDPVLAADEEHWTWESSWRANSTACLGG